MTVKGLNVAGDGVPGNGDTTDQDFALVVSNADDQPAPVLAQEAPRSTTRGRAATATGCSSRTRRSTLTEQVRNVGHAGRHGAERRRSARAAA